MLEIIKKSPLRIAISGKSGCGNTTISSALAKTLGIPLINYTFRQLANEKNMTLAEVIEKAKTDDFFDRAVDEKQIELAMKSSCVLGSRLAIWLLKDADLKIYLFAGDNVRNQRIFEREGGKIEEIAAFTKMRDAEDSKRYKTLYDLDNNDFDAVSDLVIDTEKMLPPAIVEKILLELENRSLIRL